MHATYCLSYAITFQDLCRFSFKASLGTPRLRKILWAILKLHLFLNFTLHLYCCSLSYISDSIAWLDRSFLYTFYHFFLWESFALKSKGLLSLFLVVCSHSSKQSLLILQVYQIWLRGFWLPKGEAHNTRRLSWGFGSYLSILTCNSFLFGTFLSFFACLW